VVGTPIVKDGLLYVGTWAERFTVWMLQPAPSSGPRNEWGHLGVPVAGRRRLYVGNVDGVMTVLRAGRRKELLAQIEIDAPLYSRPALVGDALYLAAARRLTRIALGTATLNP
jgi:hypothetical protein